MVEDNQYDIAVVGLACRFPGASTPDEFWELVSKGKEAVRRFSKTELINAGLDEEQVNDPNFVPASGYVEDADKFDAEFFGFSPSEAEVTDPQFRIFLECAYEALEDAGCVPDAYEGKIGTFVGSGMSLYASRDMKSYFLHNLYPHKELIDNFEHPQLILGNNREYLPTRVSYKLNLKGPSLNIQTACSTSLVAAHMACQSLLTGESDAALVGASAFHAPLKSGYLYKEGTFFSPDGHCRVFDENSEGIVGGNGAGAVILKRLDDAIKNGDHIHAIIKSSAINNDGNAKVSYTAPSFEGQVDVIKTAQSLANISPDNIGYVEAHGTGTKMGDPIEVAALSHVFREKTTEKSFCALGSVKANIGHLDTAAGMASLMKTILCLKNKAIPPQINFSKANPSLNLETSPFYINEELKEWPAKGKARTAGLSSFGAGGTNAHFVLQEYVPSPQSEQAKPDQQLLTLSAKSKEALQDLAKKYHSHLNSKVCSDSLNDVCYTSHVGRQHYKHRAAFVADSNEDLAQQLNDYQADDSTPACNKLAFLFTGQGSQYVEMGKDLYELHPHFRKTLDQCLDVLEPLFPQSPREVLFNAEVGKESINNTLYAQPLLFAVEYSLAQLWLSWGIKPQAVMGHSLGEYVAACIADVFSLEEALTLVATRAQLMASLPHGGSMMSIFATRDTVEKFIANEPEVSIAAINGPMSVVISGSKEACNRVADKLEEDGIDIRPLRVSHAFHSHLMEPILNEFKESAKKIKYKKPQIPIVSNLTGMLINDNQITAEYWADHLRNSVEFEKGINCLNDLGVAIFIEVGPKSMLVSLAQQCLDSSSDRLWLNSMNYKRNTWKELLQSLGYLYEAGRDFDWNSFHSPFNERKCSLPTYAFKRERYYIDHPATREEKTSIISFKKQWKLITQEKDSTVSPRVFLIVDKETELSRELRQGLERNGHKVYFAEPTQDNTLDLKGAVWKFNPLLNEHCRNLLEKVSLLKNDKHLQVIFSYSVNILRNDYMDIYQGMINIAQTQLELDLLDSQSLVIISANGFYTGNEKQPVNPLHAPFSAFVRCLNEELGQIVSLSIDIDPPSQISHTDALIRQIYKQNSPEEVCIRNGEVLVSRIQKFENNHTLKPPSFDQGAYLVTGGMGSIGIEVAQWLAHKGARNLIIVGRTSPPTETEKVIDLIQQKDCKVHFYKCDISCESDTKSLATFIQDRKLCLKGIVHAAGVIEDASLLSLTHEKVKNVMLPKIQGALNLEKHLDFKYIDFYLLFSSLASFLGSKGQINYSMANSFLDGYARYLSQKAIRALSIQWGPWEGKGMSSRVKSQLKSYNLSLVSNNAGLEFIEKNLFSDGPPNLSAIPVQVQNKSLNFDSLHELSEWVWNKSDNNTQISESEDVDTSTDPISRPSIFKSLQETISEILGIPENQCSEKDIGFHDLGIDSIMALQLREKLSKKFGTKLSATMVYKYPTLGELAKYLEDTLICGNKEKVKSHNESEPSSLSSLAEQLRTELNSTKAS